jgi:hypothetical protein
MPNGANCPERGISISKVHGVVVYLRKSECSRDLGFASYGSSVVLSIVMYNHLSLPTDFTQVQCCFDLTYPIPFPK